MTRSEKKKTEKTRKKITEKSNCEKKSIKSIKILKKTGQFGSVL